MEPVRGMQVWALFFGVPITTYTDGNGYYEVPWRFSLGTIMGTKAKNSRVNVKPLDTHLNGFLNNVLPVVLDFIVGSVHIDGWHGACSMKNDIDFNFTGHTQVRYWSQILNAYYFHDQYCATEGIKNAPQAMVCYAQWANDYGGNGFSSASTPMLSQLTGGQYADPIIYSTVGFTPVGVLLSVIHGMLPDMSFKVAYNFGNEPPYYNSRMAQIAFHELGHASMFRQVGAGWHLALAWAEVWHNCAGLSPYCDGNYTNGGHVALAESWAQFIGTNFALRRYPNGVIQGTHFLQFSPIAYLQEYEGYFFGGTWIPYGIYNDLNDAYNPAEIWDNVNGVSISQMYNVLGPNVESICDYWFSFERKYPQYNNNDVDNIFLNHNVTPCF